MSYMVLWRSEAKEKVAMTNCWKMNAIHYWPAADGSCHHMPSMTSSTRSNGQTPYIHIFKFFDIFMVSPYKSTLPSHYYCPPIGDHMDSKIRYMHEYLYILRALPKVKFTKAQDSRSNSADNDSKKTNISYFRLSHQGSRANIQATQAVRPLLYFHHGRRGKHRRSATRASQAFLPHLDARAKSLPIFARTRIPESECRGSR
jgi:hypothetical protein